MDHNYQYEDLKTSSYTLFAGLGSGAGVVGAVALLLMKRPVEVIGCGVCTVADGTVSVCNKEHIHRLNGHMIVCGTVR